MAISFVTFTVMQAEVSQFLAAYTRDFSDVYRYIGINVQAHQKNKDDISLLKHIFLYCRTPYV